MKDFERSDPLKIVQGNARNVLFLGVVGGVFIGVGVGLDDVAGEDTEVAECYVIVCYEEQGEHYVAQRHTLAAEEEQGDEQDEQLRQGVEVEACLAQVPHQYDTCQRESVEQCAAEEEGARCLEQLLDEDCHLARKGHRTRLIHRFEERERHSCHQIADAGESGAYDAEDKNDAQAATACGEYLLFKVVVHGVCVSVLLRCCGVAAFRS